MLTDDGNSGLWEVSKMSWNDIIRSTEFKSLYQLHYVTLWFYWKLFGANSWLYLVWFVLLQSTVLVFFYMSMCALLNLFGYSKNRFLLFCIGLILLTAPINFENIAWAATSHYNFSLLLYFVMLGYFEKVLQGERKHFILFYLAFFCSLFFMEMSLLFPLSFVLLAIMYWFHARNTKQLKWITLHYLLPLFVLLAVALGVLYFQTGSFLPRQATANTLVPSFVDSVRAFYSFCLRGVGYINFLPFDQRDWVYAKFGNYIFWPGILAFIGLLFYSFKKRKFLFVFLFLQAVIFLLPNLNRWGNILFKYENIRFVYFTLPFLYLLLLLFLYKRKKLLVFCICIVLSLNIVFLARTINDKKVAGQVQNNFIFSLGQYKSDDIYLLNIPSFVKDYFIFRYEERAAICLSVYENAPKKNIKEVLWYNGVTVTDTFEVERIADSTIKIQPKTGGVWLMYEDQGATNYENEFVKVELGEWSSYTVIFKKPLNANTKILVYSLGQLEDVSQLLR